MNRCFAVIALILTLAMTQCAHAKDILLVTGIGGEILAPMNTIKAGLEKKGHHVTRAPWYAMPADADDYDVAIGHSAGDAILHLKVRKKLTIDPTFLNQGCLHGSKCINWHSWWDAVPFIVCCGGYAVRNAKNIQVPPGHVSMPERIAGKVIQEADRP